MSVTDTEWTEPDVPSGIVPPPVPVDDPVTDPDDMEPDPEPDPDA